MVNKEGIELRLWDGEDKKKKKNGKIEGGKGIWKDLGYDKENGNDKWKEKGKINEKLKDEKLDVFKGEKGKVNVDERKGEINV